MYQTDETPQGNGWIVLPVLAVLFAAGAFAGWRYLALKATRAPEDDSAFCDMNMSKAKSMGTKHEENISANAGSPPVIDQSPAPGPAPDGMAWIPPGEFSMGTQEAMFEDTRPVHRVALDGFWMDKTEVTNE